MMEALLHAYQLKALTRAGWTRVGIEHPETVASHSWGISLLALALAPQDMNRERLLSYAAIHDLPECLAGDVTPHDGMSTDEKHRRERQAMARLEQVGLPQHLHALWLAYESQRDPESQFVRQLDKLDMAIQALLYAPSADVGEFLDSAKRGIHEPTLVAVMQEIRARWVRAV